MKLTRHLILLAGMGLAACTHSGNKPDANPAQGHDAAFSNKDGSRTPAASLSSCRTRLLKECGAAQFIDSIKQLDKMDSSATCKIVEQDGGEAVVYFDNNDIVAYHLASCERHIAQNVGRLTDEKVFDGRVFATTDANKVIMVGRNACIYELLTSSGNSYKAATGVGVDQDSDKLIIKGTSAKLSRTSIQNRIDSEEGLRRISCKKNR